MNVQQIIKDRLINGYKNTFLPSSNVLKYSIYDKLNLECIVDNKNSNYTIVMVKVLDSFISYKFSLKKASNGRYIVNDITIA